MAHTQRSAALSRCKVVDTSISAEERAFQRAKKFFAALPHSHVLGLELLAFADNTAIARLPYKPELMGNPMTGVIHGGAITTLIDQTSGAAVFASLEVPEMVATLDLRIDYLRQAEPGRSVLVRAECYRVTSSVAFVRCQAYHEEGGPLVATSVSSFMRTGSKHNVVVEEQ